MQNVSALLALKTLRLPPSLCHLSGHASPAPCPRSMRYPPVLVPSLSSLAARGIILPLGRSPRDRIPRHLWPLLLIAYDGWDLRSVHFLGSLWGPPLEDTAVWRRPAQLTTRARGSLGAAHQYGSGYSSLRPVARGTDFRHAAAATTSRGGCLRFGPVSSSARPSSADCSYPKSGAPPPAELADADEIIDHPCRGACSTSNH